MPPEHAADPALVRAFITEAAAGQKPRLAHSIQQRFGVSRATAHNYIRSLINEGVIRRAGAGQYTLVHTYKNFHHPLQGLEEHQVWKDEIEPLLKSLPANVVEIWHYGVTEMINNVIDHSGSPDILITFDSTPLETRIAINDYGVGIFRKISRALNLEDDRHAALELSKGKVTTDPANHTGEGIFFSSRSFDDFKILSGGVFFAHDWDDDEDWIIGDETPRDGADGTAVFMTLSNNSDRDLRTIFDQFATDKEEYRFDRTVVPVKLLQYGDEQLVSRSQAKRLLTRFDRFRIVVLNFDGVDSIGQAFADEVFRVFPAQHPEVEIVPINANEQVSRMLTRAAVGRDPQADLFQGRS